MKEIRILKAYNPFSIVNVNFNSYSWGLPKSILSNRISEQTQAFVLTYQSF